MDMIEWSRANFDKAAIVDLENLTCVHIAAKNELFVLERHSTRLGHILTSRVKRGQYLTDSVNQSGRFAFS